VTAPETTRSSARWLPRGLLPYATAAVVARSATEAIAPAVLLVAVATGLTAAQGALLLSCYVATGALSGPFVGALLDRTLRPKRSLSLALGGFAAALAGLAVGSGRLPFWTLAGIAAIAGLGQPAPTSGWTAQLPRVVSGAYGIDAATYSVGMIAGPGLAGIAFVLGKREPLLVPVALLCAAIVVLAFVQIAAVDAATLPAKANLRRGFTVVLRRPRLLRASVVSTIGFAGQASLIVVAPDISRQLTGGLSAVGPIFVAFAVGGLVSSLYLAHRPTANPDLWVDIGTWIVALGLVLLALANTLPLALGAAVGFGLGDGPMFTCTLRIRAREAPFDVRGQVFTTAASLRVGSYALALAGFGALLSHGVHTVIFVGIAVQFVAVALGWLSTKWHSRDPEFGFADPAG
jgi:MFS family permease